MFVLSCMLVALPKNIRLGWNWLKVVKTLAYYDTEQITGVKSFLVRAGSFVFSGDKHSSILQRRINYGCEKFCSTGHKSF